MIPCCPNLDTRGALVFAREHNGSDVYDPLQAHVYGRDESKGYMENPLCSRNLFYWRLWSQF